MRQGLRGENDCGGGWDLTVAVVVIVQPLLLLRNWKGVAARTYRKERDA